MNETHAQNLATAEQLVNRLFHGGFPEAIVAGGFLRDSILGFQPKDIDIFISRRQGVRKEDLVESIGQALGGTAKIEFNLSYTNMEVDRIIEVGIPGAPYPVQVIELGDSKAPVDRVREHDFGLCQVWLGAYYGLDATPAFTTDRQNKTCTLTHCESLAEWQRSMRRWQRLSQKLVGYRLVDHTTWGRAAAGLLAGAAL
jgi:hypothetical protein